MATKKVTSLDQLKLLAQRTKTELDALGAEIDDIVTAGGEPNKIDEIKVNGVVVSPDAQKSVDITVPESVSDLNNDSLFQTETQVDDKISAAIVGALKPAGSVTFSTLPALEAENLNKIVNVSDGFTTTTDFVEGAGSEYPAGTNVAIIDVGAFGSPEYKYDTYTGVIDTSSFATKVSGATVGNLATLDATGNIVDSGMASDMILQDANVATDEEVTTMLDEVFGTATP